MGKKLSIVLFALLGLSALFGSMFSVQTAAPAANATIGLMETMAGIQAAAAGRPGTSLWGSEETVILVFQNGRNAVLVAFGRSGQAASVFDLLDEAAPQVLARMDARSFAEMMRSRGFGRIQPADLPPALLSALSSFTLTALKAGAQVLPTPLLIPIDPQDPQWAPLLRPIS